MCRKLTGAAFRSRVAVPSDTFRWVRGEELLARYESSPRTVRTFCRVCGSAPGDHDENQNLRIGMGTLDDGPGLLPSCHVFTDRRRRGTKSKTSCRSSTRFRQRIGPPRVLIGSRQSYASDRAAVPGSLPSVYRPRPRATLRTTAMLLPADRRSGSALATACVAHVAPAGPREECAAKRSPNSPTDFGSELSVTCKKAIFSATTYLQVRPLGQALIVMGAVSLKIRTRWRSAVNSNSQATLEKFARSKEYP